MRNSCRCGALGRARLGSSGGQRADRIGPVRWGPAWAPRRHATGTPTPPWRTRRDGRTPRFLHFLYWSAPFSAAFRLFFFLRSLFFGCGCGGGVCGGSSRSARGGVRLVAALAASGGADRGCGRTSRRRGASTPQRAQRGCAGRTRRTDRRTAEPVATDQCVCVREDALSCASVCGCLCAACVDASGRRFARTRSASASSSRPIAAAQRPQTSPSWSTIHTWMRPQTPGQEGRASSDHFFFQFCLCFVFFCYD